MPKSGGVPPKQIGGCMNINEIFANLVDMRDNHVFVNKETEKQIGQFAIRFFETNGCDTTYHVGAGVEQKIVLRRGATVCSGEKISYVQLIEVRLKVIVDQKLQSVVWRDENPSQKDKDCKFI